MAPNGVSVRDRSISLERYSVEMIPNPKPLNKITSSHLPSPETTPVEPLVDTFDTPGLESDNSRNSNVSLFFATQGPHTHPPTSLKASDAGNQSLPSVSSILARQDRMFSPSLSPRLPAIGTPQIPEFHGPSTSQQNSYMGNAPPSEIFSSSNLSRPALPVPVAMRREIYSQSLYQNNQARPVSNDLNSMFCLVERTNCPDSAIIRSRAWTQASTDPEGYAMSRAAMNKSYIQTFQQNISTLLEAANHLAIGETTTGGFHAQPREVKQSPILAPRPSSSPITRISPRIPIATERARVARDSTCLREQRSSRRSRPPTAAAVVEEDAGASARKRRASKSEEGKEPAKRQRSEAKLKKKYSSPSEISNYIPFAKEDLPKDFSFNKGEKKILPLSFASEPPELVAQMTQKEIEAAQYLRLSANNFLINKRLLFRGKVNSFLPGLDGNAKRTFTKTNAQSACVIDVNKASKLWEFYTAAGLLRDELFTKFAAQESDRMRT